MSSKAVTVKGFEELRRKLKRVPQKVQKKTVLKILSREARPLVWAARKLAYADSNEPEGVYTKQARKGQAWIMNLFGSINVYKNKKNKNYHYVVVGLKSTRKKPPGAYYATWQNSGGTQKGFTPKDFIHGADKEMGEEVSRKQLNAINKEVDKILNQLF